MVSAPGRRPALVVAIILAALFGACGSASPAEQAKQAAVNFAEAYGAHDGKRVCSLLNPKTTAAGLGARGCAAAVFAEVPFNPPASPVATKASVTGSHAIVDIGGEGQDATIDLVKADGGWRVEGLSGP